MTHCITPKIADLMQVIADDHKKTHLLQLLNALFLKSMEGLEILQRKDRLRVMITMKNMIKLESLRLYIPTKVYFDVLKEGALDFYTESFSPYEIYKTGTYFWNEVTVEGEAYCFKRNGVVFEFSAPLVKTISCNTLLTALKNGNL